MAEIKLAGGYAMLIDDADAEWALQFRWRVRNYGPRRVYAQGYDPETKEVGALHRRLMRAPKGIQVDHINGDTLDNRRANLRLCSNGQNAFNRSKPKGANPYKGVTRNRRDAGSFRAVIYAHRERFLLGSFPTPEEAARAYDSAAVRLHGDFARLNFPREAA